MKEKTLWEQIWESQDKRCASCNKPIELGDTAKNSHSFKIICKDCYFKPTVLVILDEWGN